MNRFYNYRRLGMLPLLAILSFSVSLYGQNFFPILGGQRAGTSAFTFLKIGVSARAVGMGEAVVALNQDASSLYYNPGAVAQFDRTQVSATRIEWPADINYDYFSFITRAWRRHFIGLSAGILHMEPMQETTEYMPHGTGNYFTYQDRFVGLTYGIRMTDRFSFGATFKHVQEDMAGLTMQSVLMDLGTFYWTGFRSLRFSAALSHFGKQFRPSGTYDRRVLDRDTGTERIIAENYQEFSPPTVFQVGTAMDLLEQDRQNLTVAVQLNHPVDNAEYIVMGLEYALFDMVFLRAGYKLNKEEENISAGFGLNLPLKSMSLRVDYAYANFNHLSDPVRFSLGMTF